MNLKWYGHSAFKITTDNGTGIILDPYQSGYSDGALSYRKIDDEADIVFTSHDHGDHNFIKDIKGKYDHIKTEGYFNIRGVAIKTISTYHDASKGKERGNNLISVISADGLTVAHLGDLGREVLEEIGPVDVLLLPVGGFYTIDAGAATKIMNDMKPKITVPMHYRTDKCRFPITAVDEFTMGKKRVRILRESEMEITRESLPKDPEIVVMQHAR
jgi:L-ascorbate metabolism protein UlaG (beta-lactamase superfamily)